MKIAIIEMKFHEELLLPQINTLLENSHSVHLITSEKIAASDSLASIKSQIKIKAYGSTNKIISKIKMLIDIPKYIKQNQIDQVIFNTLDSKFCQLLTQRLTHLTTHGFIHNADKFISGTTFHSIVHRIDTKIVLGSYIKDYLEDQGIASKSVYLTNFGQKQNGITPIKQDDKETPTTIVIPGQLDNKRRDYQSLINACDPKLNIRIILLGNATKNDGKEIVSHIQQENLDGIFHWFDSHVPHNDFINIIAQADYIMPLVHNNCLIYDRYLSCKATAAFMWSTGFRKPMLLEEGFSKIVEFQKNSLYYHIKELSELLQTLQKPKNIFEIDDDFINQESNYINIINSQNH